MTAQNIDGRVSWPPYDEIDGETQLVCPVCGTHNNDNWPVEVNGKIKRGGCQDCWERQCDAAWWKMVVAIDTVQGNDSELSEALEADRNGNPPDDKIPAFSGIEAELADTVIRILDTAEADGLDVVGAMIAKAEMNAGRAYKHGGKAF